MKKEFTEFKEFIKGKNVGVVGVGVSNIPLIFFLVELGATVTAMDKRTEKEFDNRIIKEFKGKGVRLILGDNYLDDLTEFQVIFKTPSMRIDNTALIKAKKSGAYVTSEMEEFVKYCPAKTFGITGSDGKTTTTTIIYNILKEQGYKTWVGGNIGTPLFSKIEEMNEKDKVVLELSSFQLMTMDVSTDVAVMTNLTPNHLDMHKDMKEYTEAKKNIFKYQKKNDILVLNKDDAIVKSMYDEAKGRVSWFTLNGNIEDGAYLENNKLFIKGKEICKSDEVKLIGIHNIANLLAAFCAVYDEASIKSMRKVATTFKGVEHRCEFVRRIEGVDYYNDSIASSPTRTLAGLRAFKKPVILIAGGYDKNIPFEPLAKCGYEKIKTLILLGVTKDKIKKAFDDVSKSKGYQIDIISVNTLEEAVNVAKKIAKAGDIVTLSPACASFDMFKNFAERGLKFKRIVNNLISE